MNSKPKTPRIRWHVSPETAMHLAKIRGSKGYRSWEEFFQELIDKEVPERSLKRNEERASALKGVENEIQSLREVIESIQEELIQNSAKQDQTISLLKGILEVFSIEQAKQASAENQPKTALQKYLESIGR